MPRSEALGNGCTERVWEAARSQSSELMFSSLLHTPAPSLFTKSYRTQHDYVMWKAVVSPSPPWSLSFFISAPLSTPLLMDILFSVPSLLKGITLEYCRAMHYLSNPCHADPGVRSGSEPSFLDEQTDALGKADWGVLKQPAFSFPSTVRSGSHL